MNQIILPSNTNLNIDSKTLEQCLKSITNFGNTVYQNICTGQVTSVAWGNADWFLGIFLVCLGIGVLIGVYVFIKVLFFDF